MNTKKKQIPSKKEHLISTDVLADILRIKEDRLIEICDFFDSDPDDDWTLEEDKHFIFTNKSAGIRLFKEAGALEIAKYVEQNDDKKSLWRQIVKKFFDLRHKKYVNSLIMERVCEIGSIKGSIVVSGGRPYITTKETRFILRLHTRQDILNKAFDHEQRGEHGRSPMRNNYHFISLPDDEKRRYSPEGIKRLSIGLQAICKSRSTKSWNSAVQDSIFRSLKEVTKQYILDDSRLQRTVNLAKSKANKCCELTGRKKTKAKANKYFQLAAHHLYDKNNYPFLQYELNNIIAIDSILHKDFHAWMKGFDKSCTAEDFLESLQMQPDEIFGKGEGSSSLQVSAIANVKRRIQFLRPALDAMEPVQKITD